DKGRALLWLLDAMGLDRPEILPFYIGDDITDEDAFRALAGRGAGILVSEEPRETAAEYQLRDPEEVRAFLERLAARDTDPKAPLQSQTQALVDLAKSGAVRHSLEAAFEQITRAAAETLRVERASIWLYDADRTAIRCADLYEMAGRRHTRGGELRAEDYPSYFAALQTERAIAADDARSDPRTREFKTTYLEPLGISSMLDAPIRAAGRMIGVVCHEHVGPPRSWTGDEQRFAGSIADAASLAYEENERRRTEAALRASQEDYRRIVETAQEGIWSIDAEGRTTYANPHLAEMLGYSVQEMIGMNAFDLTPPEELDRAREHWDQRTQGFSGQVEFVFLRKDGSPLWTHCTATPVRDAEGRFAGAFAMVTDVTGRKRAEAERERLLAREQAARAEAEAANRTKDEFLATVSHELRTPLNAMLGWVHLLRSGSLDAKMTERAMETIERNIQAQAQIIDDILDVSRIVRGSLTLNVRAVDLAAVLHQAVESLGPAAQAKGIALRIELDSAENHVAGDPDRLQQVAWNLLSNAIKFTPRGGEVTVRLSREGDDLRFEVSDTGEGITPEFLPHVFERFRQENGSTTRVHGGLGLGLAIVRHLVELHGGTVEAESAGPERGSRFTVTLPALPPGPPSASLVSEGPGHGVPALPLSGLRLLLVDDDLDTCEAMAYLLAQAGARVVTASSVPEALNEFERSRPDVLVSDIGMPDRDGYDLLRQVRMRSPERGGGIPAVAMTAYARPEDRVRALAAGFQEHVPKPVDPGDLVTVLARLAGRDA
ncbi:MAG TPA: ATP-binding protein, partial [Thermoanaerobaculia bacterium]|nr:ATP-binding protein [Thermoanaerobaculia bacterium]